MSCSHFWGPDGGGSRVRDLESGISRPGLGPASAQHLLASVYLLGQ